MLLLGLVACAYLLAWIFVAMFWPSVAIWVIYLNLFTLIVFPISYWGIKRFIAQSKKWPFFVFQFDLILPVVPYFLVMFALIAPLPQFATFVWGKTTVGVVQDLQTELSTNIDQSYRVTTTYFTEAGGQWTKNIYIGRKLFNTLAIDDSVTLHYLPQFPNRAIIADPFLMKVQARLLMWCMFTLIGWLAGVFINNYLRINL